MSHPVASRLCKHVLAVLCCLLALSSVQPAHALQKATVQLKWLHHFQFAGYYAALEKGFYREAGLDVTIVEGGPNVEVEKQVSEGKADFGVGTSALLLHRAKGRDLVVLGQIFQHSPAVFLTPRKTGIRSIADMAGRKFMYSNQHGDMLALLKKNGIDENAIVQVPHQGDPRDLINGKAEVMIAYSFNEPFILEQAGEAYLTFSPLTYGIDFYGDNFFTTRKLVDERPEFVKAFREATLRGWRYALSNKAEIADLVLAKYSREKNRDWLLFEANQMETLIQPDLVELGYQSPSRWQQISEIFTGLGMLPPGSDPSAIIYHPKTPKDYRALLLTILVSGAIIAVLASMMLTFRRLNLRLHAEIAERTQAEEELRISEQKYANIFELMPDMVGITRLADGCFVEVNRGFERCTGWKKDEVVGRSSLDLGLWDRDTRARAIEIVGEKGHLEDFDFTLTIKSGASRHAVMFLIPITLEGIQYLCFLARDVTEQRMMQAEFLKSQKLESLAVLAGGIAHDFNNILTAIMGNISFARMDIDESHAAYPPLARAEKAVQRAAELARQLLVFAKGGQPVKKVVSLRQIVDEAVSLALSGTNVQAVVDFPTPLHAVEADEGQISQSFHNIIINAAHAMPGGGKLTVHGENVVLNRDSNPGLPAGDYVKLSFNDEGRGIPEADRSKIFDPYFTTKEGGTGLGLASTHAIVTRHGGQIVVESAVGKGSTFTIYLPSLGKAYSDQSSEGVPADAGFRGGSILVMDDDDMVRDLACLTLKRLGYAVTTCVNGDEAISLYASARERGAPFTLVIMDLTIPGGMGGIEAARRIRAFDPEACLIVSSGYSDDPVMANCGEYGFCAAIEKPYRVEDIADVLRRVKLKER
ncbi:MAG: response regulator [Desulfuromonadales bacterium]|nr:MAG: response regulator [Desulfuromonadales bacterium]